MDDSSMQSQLSQTQPVPPPDRTEIPDADCVAWLRSTTGGDGLEMRLDKKEYFIGRLAACDIVVKDKRVSARHLRIYSDEQGHYVVQLSANGCWLNEKWMAKDDKRMLLSGDIFSLVNHGTCDRDTTPDLRPFAAWTFSVKKNEAASVVPDSIRSRTAPIIDDICEGRTVTPEWVAERWDTRTVLGRGNFSEVHLGLKVKDHINDDRKYAVKVIDIKTFLMFQNKRESHLDLTSEAKALKALQHDGIIRIYDFFQTDEKFYLIMEFVAAGDLLHSIVEDGCFSEYQARRFFRQLCEAVEYLHSQDFIHRDLKPDNILLTTRDRDCMKMKIADFGLARKTLKTRDCQTFCGTPQYFAPEVINTFKEKDSGTSAGYDKPADMWSLGVILYIMLSGVPPFEEDDLYEQILEAKFEFDVDEWNPISREAKDLVGKLMTVEVKLRITISQALHYIQTVWLMAKEVTASPQRRPKSLQQLGEARTAKRRRTGEGLEGTF